MIATRPTPLQDERFLMLEALGRGGMSAVYRAFDRTEQRLVAIKVPRAPGGGGPAHPLATEFECWARLRHPNVVQAWELAHAERGPIPEGTPYLVLEHVRGRPVHLALPAGQVGAAVAEAVAAQMLAALAHVHAAGLVHRDLKPANVLAAVGSDGRPCFKLTDFGLAARIGDAGRVGTISGSLPWVSPEALLGRPLDGRSDLYGLGLLLYQFVTGSLAGPTGVRELLDWHVNGPAVDPGRLRPGLSPRLRRFIQRLTRRDPADRPASAVRALELLGVRSPEHPSPRPPLAARGILAALRLALDATRLGARRVFRLPADPAIADVLLRELAVWCQVRGLRHYRAGDRPERLVLRLLGDRGGSAESLVRRYALDRWLRLDTIGGCPLADPARAAGPVPAAGRAVTELVLDCARCRPLVLCFDEAKGSELMRAVERAVVDALRRASGSDVRGLLVVRRGDAPPPPAA
jgi:hypothetical protein